MDITTVLFDLDGTLLPMDNDEFTKEYFKLLTLCFEPRGYEPRKLVKAVWAGTSAMVKNIGVQSNEEVFWDKFSEIYGDQIHADRPVFDAFYNNEFQKAKMCCGFEPKAAAIVHKIKKSGRRVILATNPIFPAVATESRIRWAGLAPEDFEMYTTYENIGFCKPNPDYYKEIINRMGLSAANCLMVGNDVREDIEAAQSVGMNVFLLTDCLINRENTDISVFPHGGFDKLDAMLFQNLYT